MVEVLHKFPSTPHLLWLGRMEVRGDKVLSTAELEAFLQDSVIVEEKIDGANLGISFDASGGIRFQNRGQWLTGKLTGQWRRLRSWAVEHQELLRASLPEGHILFGEWCFATHSIYYDRLPDWFLAFDVYDINSRKFWNVARRDSLVSRAHLATVPALAVGRFSIREIVQLAEGTSAYGAASREGLYLRQEKDGWLIKRAKVVRADFTQSIKNHWSKKQMTANSTFEGFRYLKV